MKDRGVAHERWARVDKGLRRKKIWGKQIGPVRTEQSSPLNGLGERKRPVIAEGKPKKKTALK